MTTFYILESRRAGTHCENQPFKSDVDAWLRNTRQMTILAQSQPVYTTPASTHQRCPVLDSDCFRKGAAWRVTTMAQCWLANRMWLLGVAPWVCSGRPGYSQASEFIGACDALRRVWFDSSHPHQ